MYTKDPLEESIKAGWPSYQLPGMKVLIDAFTEMGYPYAGDCAHGESGVAWFPNSMNQKNASRSFAKTAHLDGLDRPNYSILSAAKVTKVLFDDDKVAHGVAFHARDGNPKDVMTVSAKKGVILALGTVHSPQVLQISGIGPKGVLEEAGIEVIVDLPGVGQNFHDHPDASLPCTCKF
jgi:choline dehydrogenase-like flavoprotein